MTKDTMTLGGRAPRLVFFQFQYDPGLPEFLLIHKRDHVRCLAHFFDVTVIDRDCDYEQICETHEPDLALFETGVNHSTCRALRIRNVRRCARVPKVALHNADAFCNARAGFLSDLDHLGIETVFAISTTAAEHTPEIADRLFVWPNAIDPATFRDYGVWKSIPVLTGNADRFYPWRQRVFKQVSERFPVMTCPHPGYDPGSLPSQILTGERYARLINASFVVPTCGTVAHEVVRKHFEIPGCRAALMTERSAGLEAAGFADMVNCIFAEAGEAMDKLQHLFRNPGELQQITDRGFALVHERHTFRQRDQILRWYLLQASRRPDQRIVQCNPFGPLTSVDSSSAISTTHVEGRGIHLRLLRRGDEMFAAGRIAEAEREYVQCMQFMRWMPEPRLRAARCRLLRGDARGAHALLVEPIEFVLGSYGAADPDPVEWAYYLIALLAMGQHAKAARCAGEYEWLRHPELDRARTLVALALGRTPSCLPVNDMRATLHQLPALEWSAWLAQACRMLEASGRGDLAAGATHGAGIPSVDLQGGVTGPAADRHPRLEIDAKEPARRAARSARGFRRTLRVRTVLRRVRQVAARNLRGTEARSGAFLPHKYSISARSGPFGAITDAAAGLNITTALIIGSSDQRCVESLLDATSLRSADRVFCVAPPTGQLRRLRRRLTNRVTFIPLARSSEDDDVVSEIEGAIEALTIRHGIQQWDAVLIDGGTFDNVSNSVAPIRAAARAQLVVLSRLNVPYMFAWSQDLLNDPGFLLKALDPSDQGGYAIFAARADRASANQRSEQQRLICALSDNATTETGTS